jgi:hypothetical protein
LPFFTVCHVQLGALADDAPATQGPWRANTAKRADVSHGNLSQAWLAKPRKTSDLNQKWLRILICIYIYVSIYLLYVMIRHNLPAGLLTTALPATDLLNIWLQMRVPIAQCSCGFCKTLQRWAMSQKGFQADGASVPSPTPSVRLEPKMATDIYIYIYIYLCTYLFIHLLTFLLHVLIRLHLPAGWHRIAFENMSKTTNAPLRKL